MASTPKRSGSEGTNNRVKRSIRSFRSFSLIYLQKKAASVACGLSESTTVVQIAPTKRAAVENYNSSDLMAMESRVFRAAFFAAELSPSSRTKSLTQSVAVTRRTCVVLHWPEMRYTTTD